MAGVFDWFFLSAVVKPHHSRGSKEGRDLYPAWRQKWKDLGMSTATGIYVFRVCSLSACEAPIVDDSSAMYAQIATFEDCLRDSSGPDLFY